MADGTTEPTAARRVLFASSAGGHLAQLLRLDAWSAHHTVKWVTFELPDSISNLAGRDVTWAYHPTTRNVKNLVRNTVLAAREMRRFRPEIVISSGAAIAVPFFWVAKLFGAKTVYIEVIDRIDTRTMTARMVSPVTDLFVAQTSSQLEMFPGSHLIGALL